MAQTEVMGVLAQHLQASGHRALEEVQGMLGIVHRNILMCKLVTVHWEGKQLLPQITFFTEATLVARF